MFDKSADLYDLIYSQFKNYPLEVEQIHHLIKQNSIQAKDILDVGSGTGEHAYLLARDYGYHVDGIDIEPSFIELAQKKHSAGTFTVADMKNFELHKTYEVILCLFSSIGYAGSLENLQATLRRFRYHLAPGGLVIVEPWLEPQAIEEGKIYMHTVHTEELKVCRMSHMEVNGRKSILRFEYLVGRHNGISSFQERHEMGLFTQEEMTASFKEAGFEVSYEASGLIGRGIYLGRSAV